MRLTRATRIPLALAAGALTLTGAGVLAAGEAGAVTGKVITGDGYTLSVRSAPHSSAPEIAKLRNGETITIECQTTGDAVTGDYGTLTTWDRLPGGGYVADAWIYTGTNGRVAPECGDSAPAPAAVPTGDRKTGATRTTNPFVDYKGYCTWGAQEKIREATGYYVSALTGHAGQWYQQAKDAGWSVTLDAQPRSVVVFSSSIVGGVGHVGWVDSVEERSDGRYVHITEMNWGAWRDQDNLETVNFDKFTTRVVKDVPGMSYILIP